MASYSWIDVDTPEAFERLADLLDPAFDPTGIAKRLKHEVTGAVKSVLAEHGYVDKDYRSTLYNYYAKKGRTYRRDCVRLHFFDGTVRFDKGRTDIVCEDARLEDHYFGYIVLRPTMAATLGRSVLSPEIREDVHGFAIQSVHVVNVLGRRLSVLGFPSMAQHADIAVCAHVSCWAILRYYTPIAVCAMCRVGRFPRHREYLIHEVATLASPFDPGGLVPSFGLSVWEAERVFQAAGCYPVMVTKKQAVGDDDEETGEDEEFFEQLLAYLESGFPLFVEIRSRRHAVVAVGYSWRSEGVAPAGGRGYAWERVDALLMVDDNMLPYRSVPARPTASEASGGYTAADFDRFIVALPEKIHYPAAAVDELSQELAEALIEGFGVPEGAVELRRYFMTTISELRARAREFESQMGEDLVRLVMELDSAQFVWVVEFCSAEQWENGHVTGRAIVDATASEQDPVPTLLLHDGRLAIVFDRSHEASGHRPVHLRRPVGVALPRMELNLQRV